MEKILNLNFKLLKELSQQFSLLYVEDDKIIRDKTATIFKNLFDKVDVAENGVEAIELYKKFHNLNSKYYDIVISDIQMPHLNGIGLTKEIFLINKKQKIIIVSAFNDKEYLIDLINIGVEGFMQKPLSSQNMLQILYDTCCSFKDDCILTLNNSYTYNTAIKTLFLNKNKVILSENESKLLELLIKNKNQSFSAIEIFNYIYYHEPEKQFSMDSIKSLIKRLRKKTPESFILNTQQLGYSANF